MQWTLQARLEAGLEEARKAGLNTELRLQDELCATNCKLLDKEKEIETLKVGAADFAPINTYISSPSLGSPSWNWR